MGLHHYAQNQRLTIVSHVALLIVSLLLLSTSANAAELVEYSRASKAGVGNCPLKYPANAQQSAAFRHGLSTDCYSCPKGFVRNITSISSNDACIKVSIDPGYSKATFETKAKIAGAFFDIGRREWWKCPNGYPRRTLYAVTDPKACATKSLWPNEKLASAVKLGSAATYPQRSSRAFLDIGRDEWWSCPVGYLRTLAPVTASNACRKTPSIGSARAVKRGVRGCPAGAFAHGLSGECYTCPRGYSRSLAIGEDLSKLNTACVKVDVAGFANEEIRQRLLLAINELNLPTAVTDIERVFGDVVGWVTTNSNAIGEVVSKEVSEERRKQLVKGMKQYFEDMGKDLAQWNPKSTSLGFAGDASYGIGVAATDPMVVWKLESNLASLNDWGLYWAVNGTLGASAGASVAPEIGYWTDLPRDLAGPAYGVVFGGSAEVGISVTYWWALDFQSDKPKFIGMTVTPGFGVEAEAEMIVGYTTSYTDGFTSGSPPPANPGSVSSQPPTAEHAPLSALTNYVPDGMFMNEMYENYNGPFRQARVKKSSDGTVTISGLIKNLGAADNIFEPTIGMLSPGYAPPKRLVFTLNHHDETQRVDVLPTGEVKYIAGSKKYNWANLTGIHFSTTNRGYQNLPLINGWRAYGKNYTTPQYQVSGDLITISGLVRAPANRNAPIAVLPPNARPSKRLIFSVNTHDSTSRVDVLPNGQILWVTGSTRYDWLSLSGIKFVRAQSRANSEKRLLRGWPAYGEDYAAPYFVKTGKTVVIAGLAKVGTGNIIGKLPSQYHPAATLIFNVNNHGKSARVDVRSNGDIVWIAGGKDHGWISLSGIVFDIP